MCVYVPLQGGSWNRKNSALHIASKNGLESAVAKLLSLGADAALTHQMVDGVATLDDLISKMRRAGKAQAKPTVSRLAQARNALALF